MNVGHKHVLCSLLSEDTWISYTLHVSLATFRLPPTIKIIFYGSSVQLRHAVRPKLTLNGASYILKSVSLNLLCYRMQEQKCFNNKAMQPLLIRIKKKLHETEMPCGEDSQSSISCIVGDTAIISPVTSILNNDINICSIIKINLLSL